MMYAIYYDYSLSYEAKINQLTSTLKIFPKLEGDKVTLLDQHL